MAEARVSVDVDQFKCPICLELLTDPVTINCGHSFCNNCIQHKWNIDGNTGVYSCPLCRQKFSSRPALGRNVMLADMVARMRKMNLHTATRQLAEPDDEKCNVCTGKKYKAIKTCLVCLASYCEIHLNLHRELNPDNKHWMVDATGKLQDKICKDHKKLKDMYCCEDQKSVCVACVTSHTGHRIIQSYHARYERSTQALEKDSEKPFKDLISFITRQQRVVKDMIKVREQKELQRLDRIQKQHQMDLVQLKNRTDQLDQLECTEDHIYFLQRMPLLYAASEFESPKITVNTSIFKDLKESVSNIKTQVEQLCKQEIKTTKTEIPLIRTSMPIIREDFLRYFQPLSLDPKSAHKNLELSHDNTKLTWTDCANPYSYIPERFSYLAQALCMQGLSSCSYWEVEWGGPQVYIAVAYSGILRNGCNSSLGFGHNNKSWSLCCSQSRSFICHDYKETDVLDQVSSRIGVFLDHSRGTLTFYSVSDDIMSLILQIKAKFTEPLYPGFWVFDGSYVRLCPVSENAGQPHTVKDIKKQKEEKGTPLSQFYLWGEH